MFKKSKKLSPKTITHNFQAQEVNEKIEAAKYFQQAMDVNNITNEIEPSDIQERLNSLFN